MFISYKKQLLDANEPACPSALLNYNSALSEIILIDSLRDVAFKNLIPDWKLLCIDVLLEEVMNDDQAPADTGWLD